MDLLTRNISNFVNEHTQGRAQQQWLFLDWHGVVDTTNVQVASINCWPQVKCVLYNVSTDPDLPIFIDFIMSKKYN